MKYLFFTFIFIHSLSVSAKPPQFVPLSSDLERFVTQQKSKIDGVEIAGESQLVFFGVKLLDRDTLFTVENAVVTFAAESNGVSGRLYCYLYRYPYHKLKTEWRFSPFSVDSFTGSVVIKYWQFFPSGKMGQEEELESFFQTAGQNQVEKRFHIFKDVSN